MYRYTMWPMPEPTLTVAVIITLITIGFIISAGLILHGNENASDEEKIGYRFFGIIFLAIGCICGYAAYNEYVTYKIPVENIKIPARLYSMTDQSTYKTSYLYVTYELPDGSLVTMRAGTNIRYPEETWLYKNRIK